MNFKWINRIAGAVVFLSALVVYAITVQPTMSFWDCGEFLACAYTVGVPHPPGAPLHILVGRLFTMMPFFQDIGLRMNYLSVISSALSALMLYLVIVRVIRNWKGNVENTFDKFVIVISAVIGALSLAFSDSFWFNALEAEVYGFGTFLLTLSVYLLMVWWDNADKPNSDKYLLALAFVCGLALGIHLLVIQIVFIAGLMFYFRRFTFSWKGFIIAVVLSAAAFFIFFPGITYGVPELLSGKITLWVVYLIIVVLAGIFTYKAYPKVSRLILISIVLAVIGYSTYLSAMMRAQVKDLPVNNNDPENIERLISYLGREQYGEQPLVWPRRYSQEPMHQRTWRNYSSDLDFMWKYQIKEMYNRYLLWQYIGRESYDQGAGVDFSKFYAIPFLLGMLGVFYHFRKDKKLAFVFLMMFLVMGVLTALYQNQQDPQPRERDYFYIGSFFAFSLWIGLGVAGLSEVLRDFIKTKAYKPAVSVLLLASFIFVPVNMLKVNIKYQSRAGNFFPYDYAYNLLQSCDKDAILITNGDNDTFPLWCLQAVYGVRTDVRVVNLSLAQIDWYNLQLKNERPYGALTVPMTLTDQQLKSLRPTEWDDKVITLDVPPEAYPDTMTVKPEKMNFVMPASLHVQQGGRTVNAVRANDLLVLDILRANKWKRPIYFSMTVSEDYYIGLNDYLLIEGMAQRIVPYKVGDRLYGSGVNIERTSRDIMQRATSISKEPQQGFMYRGLNNPKIFYDQTQRRMIDGYRMLFLRLAHKYQELKDYENLKATLNALEEYIPRKVVEIDYRFEYDIAMMYLEAGDRGKFDEFAKDAEEAAIIDKKNITNAKQLQNNFNPYKILIDLYEASGNNKWKENEAAAKVEYQNAIDVVNELLKIYPNNGEAKMKMNILMQKMESGTTPYDSLKRLEP